MRIIIGNIPDFDEEQRKTHVRLLASMADEGDRTLARAEEQIAETQTDCEQLNEFARGAKLVANVLNGVWTIPTAEWAGGSY